MVNGKRLLFGLLASTILGRRARRVGRGFAGPGMGMRGGGMGLLGAVALMAARHFMSRRQQQPGSAGGAVAGAGGGGPNLGGLDLGGLFGGVGGGTAAPGAAAATAPEAPLDAPPTPAENEEAMTLIRAMVAAAQADGRVDPEERQRVVDGLTEAGAAPEERDFILAELDRPHDLDSVIASVRTREMAEEVYGAALLAIEVDTEAERWFLRNLAARLDLDDAAVAELHERFEAPRP